MDTMLTVFTPTYNRKEKLGSVYSSLIDQIDKDFIWMIVDDGSDDGTRDTVQGWIAENRIRITYHTKENGGKHTAYNLAVDNCATDYMFVALDSDDFMPRDAVSEINGLLRSNPGCCGIVGLAVCDNGRKPDDIEKFNMRSMYDVLSTYDFSAETGLVIRTEYLKKFKYPVIEGEKFFTEAYTYYQMTEPFIWTNKVFRTSTYCSDGLTKNIYRLYAANPKSFYMYQKMRSEITVNFKKKLKSVISADAFYIMSGQSEKKSALARLFMPLGFLYYKYIMHKNRT